MKSRSPSGGLLSLGTTAWPTFGLVRVCQFSRLDRAEMSTRKRGSRIFFFFRHSSKQKQECDPPALCAGIRQHTDVLQRASGVQPIFRRMLKKKKKSRAPVSGGNVGASAFGSPPTHKKAVSHLFETNRNEIWQIQCTRGECFISTPVLCF